MALSLPDRQCVFFGRTRVFSFNDRFAFFQFSGVSSLLLTRPPIVPLIRPLTPPQRLHPVHLLEITHEEFGR